jgi:hypothetical protein
MIKLAAWQFFPTAIALTHIVKATQIKRTTKAFPKSVAALPYATL